jgi:hypothetical protein
LLVDGSAKRVVPLRAERYWLRAKDGKLEIETTGADAEILELRRSAAGKLTIIYRGDENGLFVRVKGDEYQYRSYPLKARELEMPSDLSLPSAFGMNTLLIRSGQYVEYEIVTKPDRHLVDWPVPWSLSGLESRIWAQDEHSLLPNWPFVYGHCTEQECTGIRFQIIPLYKED